MDVDIISVGVETLVEHERGVHEGAGVHQTALLREGHLLNVKHETTVEYLKSQGTLTTEHHDLLIGNLVSHTHIGGDPFLLVNSWQLSPYVSLDVVTLNGVHDSLLVYSPSKGENVLILECTQSHSRPWHIQ